MTRWPDVEDPYACRHHQRHAADLSLPSVEEVTHDSLLANSVTMASVRSARTH